MKQLELLSKNEFEEVFKIMEESFPIDERREKSGQEKILSDSYYRLYGYKRETHIAAFFAVWEFPEFSFIEHFAVEKSSRNLGIGAKLLQELLGMIKKPVVLEVELPVEELAERRIGFYKRNGFQLNDYEYEQPAMSEKGKAIPLKIMSYPDTLSEKAFEGVRDQLYISVYKQKK